ncbi:MAG: class I SAM-dependent methyltransferase [Bradymonadia bacterium]
MDTPTSDMPPSDMVCPTPQESPPCPVCGNETFTPVFQGARDYIWRKPGRFTLARCTRCTLVITRPRPTPEGIGFYYENAYSGEAQAGMKRFQTESAIGKLIARYRLRVIHKVRSLTAQDRVLDVGCSYGGFLRVAREVTGCETSGIDLDADSIKDAVDTDQTDYKIGRLEEVGYPDERFSVITFFQSLEHTHQPVDALAAARKALEPGGLCVVEVPDFNGVWRRVFRTAWLPLLIPQHLSHFTPKSLRAAFEAAGFTAIKHRQSMFYPFEGVASLGIWLGRVLKSPPPGSPPSWRTPFDLLILLILMVLYVVVEIPSQAIMQLLGVTGHQIMIAQKPPADSSAPEA